MTNVLIVSHGQPSDPGPAEARLSRFGENVARHLLGAQIKTATLAAPGRLGRAVEDFGDIPFWVYPLFMSDGWFVSSQLPKRMAAAGGKHRILPPLGLDPGMPDLVATAAMESIAASRFTPEETTVILAAHGSPRDPRPAAAAHRQAAGLVGVVGDTRIGFVDETPSIVEAAAIDGPAIALPLFAATNGHVRIDVAEALAQARFKGPVLPPIGEHPDVPGMVAGTIHDASAIVGVDS